MNKENTFRLITSFFLITIGIILLFLSFTRSVSAYTLTPIGGIFDGDYLYVSCEAITPTAGADIAYVGVGTSTYPLWPDIMQGTTAWNTCEDLDYYFPPYGWFGMSTSTMSGYGAGTYYLISGKVDAPDYDLGNYYYTEFEWNGTTITDYNYYEEKTGFISFTPSNGETRIPSEDNTLYAGLYLTEEDYIPDSYIRLRYVRQQDLQSAVANSDLLWTELDLNDIITSGYSFVATSTGSLGFEGVYYLRGELRKPSTWYTTALSWINPFNSLDPDIITASSTQFIYGEMTAFDRVVASTTASIDDYTASTTISFEQVGNDCNPLSFSLAGCFGGIFGWQGPQMAVAVNDMKNNLFSYVPFGYVTRFMDIANSNATTSLPALTYTFSATSALPNETITFDPWQYISFTEEGVPLNDIKSDREDSKNVWEIFEPYYKTVVYLLLAILIIGDIMGIAVGSGGGGSRFRRRYNTQTTTK